MNTATCLDSYVRPAATSTVTIALRSLNATLSKHTNEYDLLETVHDQLERFEEMYRADPTRFTEPDIRFLRKVRCLQQSLETFIDICSEIAVVRSREEAQFLIDQLFGLSEQMEGFSVLRRVQKEIRALNERMHRLPSEESTREQGLLNRRIAKLNSAPPRCKKCGSRMTVRHGPTVSPFWGCADFPRCFGREWLTRNERNSLAAE